MKTYQGQRTNDKCTVTVDGQPLRPRSDLTGNATTGFEWGFISGGPLSLALLSDYFGSDQKAKAMCGVFEEHVIAVLPRESWTLTGYSIGIALEHLVGLHGARANDVETDGLSAAAFGDMPVAGTDRVLKLRTEDTAAVGAMIEEPSGPETNVRSGLHAEQRFASISR